MAPTSQAKEDARIKYGNLFEQIRQLYGRTAYSHKTHEKQADLELSLYNRLTNSQIWLSALTTGSLILAVFGDGKTGTIVGALLATLQFGLNLYLKEINLQEKAASHSSAAQELWRVREKLMTLITDMQDKRIETEQVLELRTSYMETLEKVYTSALRTTPRAYSMAQRALKTSGDLSFSESELDHIIG
ncbi:hypothetical protein HNQ07_003852 [Deinococcus metalli]|uniref:SMODS and SLOG-associating 2TM effector domain-containing protein n=1 Tax=Deinococcus metalli TaxID=1141878 RepID=A0A7W8KJZ4_9DEIO|nr:SLATT domain-containing protein [Deinococcus metalli]MBB5378346.1 hypothetical protein [Deinococcus metalli]GHF59549.1 hypothetical protein GCM10017781_39850 [Deinococcus metalli]